MNPFVDPITITAWPHLPHGVLVAFVVAAIAVAIMLTICHNDSTLAR